MKKKGGHCLATDPVAIGEKDLDNRQIWNANGLWSSSQKAYASSRERDRSARQVETHFCFFFFFFSSHLTLFHRLERVFFISRNKNKSVLALV